MFCGKCGHELENQSGFCPKCGEKVELNLSAHQNYKEETKEKEGFLNFLYADLKRSLLIGATMALIALFATLVSSLLGSLVYDLFGFYEFFVIRNVVNNEIEEAISALQVLGYNNKDAVEMVNKSYKEGMTIEEIIKMALRSFER